MNISLIGFARIVLACALLSGLPASAQDPRGFFLDGWESKSISSPDYGDSEKPYGTATAIVTVNAATVVTKVSPYVFGNNANTWSTLMVNNPELIRNIRNLAPHVIRYPGGNLSNVFFWDRLPNQAPADIPSDTGPWYGRNEESWTLSVDAYYRFLNAVGSTGIICVNYSYARYGLSANPVQNAAHYAADWVRYDDGRTAFWEIGNENFGNWQAGYEIDIAKNRDGQPRFISGELYGRHFRVFADSMRAAAAEKGHTIRIGAVAYDAATSWDPIQTKWNPGLMKETGGTADFYIVHTYYTPYNENSTGDGILKSPAITESLRKVVWNALAAAGFGPKPVALTEYNIFAIGSKQMVSHVNGLHADLVLGELIRTGFGLGARWDLANGWDNGNDHGMFARGEPGVPEFNPRPAFYHMVYFQKCFGDRMVASTVSGSEDVAAYASTFESGQAGIVIVNKGRREETVEIRLDGFATGGRYYWYVLKGGTDNGEFSGKVFINDKGPSLPAGGPEDYDAIKAYSCPIDSLIKFAAPARSALYVLVEGKKSEGSGAVKGKVSVYPNPGRKRITIQAPGIAYSKIEIFDVLGRRVVNMKRISSGDEPEALDLLLPAGVYVVRLDGGGTSASGKMVVE